jgi:MFS family permease
MHGQCLLRRHKLRFSGAWLDASSQPLPHPGLRVFIGAGFAINAPAWTSIVPPIVSDAELPSAATLSGLQFNISGIIGPTLSGLLVPLVGANFVFALNAACFLLVVVATRQWKQPTLSSKLPSESFFESFGTIIRYARNAPGFQDNKDQENGALRGLLIFIVPASHFPFLVALNLSWLDVTERTTEEKRSAS